MKDTRTTEDIIKIFSTDFNTIYTNFKKYTNGVVTWNEYYENDPHANSIIGIAGKIHTEQMLDTLVNEMSIEQPRTYSNPNSLYKPATLIDIPDWLEDKIPRIRDDVISYNTNLGYTPIAPEFEYITNFAIDYDGVDVAEINPKLNDDAIKHNVIRGQKKMFHNQIRLRGPSPEQSILLLMLTYKCDKCMTNVDYECRCYITSPEIVTLLRLCKKSRGIPFYINKFGQVVKNKNYQQISSQLPGLWFSLIDLGLRHRLGAVDEVLACHIVNAWLLSTKISIYWSILYDFKKYKKGYDYIMKGKQFIAPIFDNNFNIVGSSNHVCIREESEKSFKESGLDGIINMGKIVDGSSALKAIYQLQHLSPSVIVSGSIELLMRKSAEGTQPVGAMMQDILMEADLGVETNVPIRFGYNDIDVLKVRAKLLELLEKHPPGLDKLESEFIEAATTNSAGLSPQERKERSIEIIKAYGDDLDSRAIAKCAGVRLYDVLEVIQNDLKNVETVKKALNTENIAGLRYQLGRRLRLIQMLRTIFMCGPFVIKTVLDDVILKSNVAATGKTTNDIRDSYSQCKATSIGVKANSDDVSGMDTSTHKAQTSFITEIVLLHMKNRREEIGKFFLDVDRIPVETYEKNGNDIITSVDEVTVAEYLVMFENYAINRPRVYKGGYFSKECFSSNITFESGTYKTSAQHTSLLLSVYEVAKEIFENKYSAYGIKLHASVLGDDQFSYIVGIRDSGKLNEISDEIKNWVSATLQKLGYVTDSSYEIGYGEFLKQAAYFGVPCPYSVRLPQLTSERGEKGTIFDQLKNIYGVLGELSARVPYPNGVIAIQYGLCMILGSVIWMDRSMVRSGEKATLSNLDKSGLDYNHWKEDRYIMTLPKIWYINHALGTPTPAYKSNDGGIKMSTFLTFPSPAYLRHMIALTKFGYEMGVNAYTGQNPAIVIKGLGELQKKYWRSVLRAYGSEFVSHLWKTNPNTYPKPLKTFINYNGLVESGIGYGYILSGVTKMMQDQVEIGPKFKKLQELGNAYLDANRKMLSHKAYSQLKDMGIKLSETVVYFNRVGARLESVLRTRSMGNERALETDRFILMCENKFNLIESLTEQLSFGVYELNKTVSVPHIPLGYDTFELGLGPCVPPKSIQSMYINFFGLPRLSDYDVDSVKKGIETALLIEGTSTQILRALSQAYRLGGITAVELAMEAIGLGERVRAKIRRLQSDLGYETMSMPYAINPRKLYYYGTSLSTQNKVNFKPSSFINPKLEWAIYVSELMMNPELMNFCITVSSGSLL